MGQRFKVEELLNSAEMEELEKFAREPGRTIDEVHQWLLERQFNLSGAAAYNWKRSFDERQIGERMRAGGGLAKAMLDAAKESGGVAVSDAAVLQVAQMIFESASSKASAGEVDPDDLNKFSLALQRLTLAKKRVEEVRGKFDTAAKSLVGKRSITQEDIDEVRKATFG